MRLPDSDNHFAPYAKQGSYQQPIYLEALKHVRNFACAIDIGAHVGFWTREMAPYFGTVYAFEPVKENFDCLFSNVAEFANVKPFNKAVGSANGECEMRNPSPGNSGAWEWEFGTGTHVLALDDLNLSSIGLIKIDVQGAEGEVLEGAKETLKRCKPVVVVECWLNGIYDPRPHDILSGLGAILHSTMAKDRIYGW